MRRPDRILLGSVASLALLGLVVVALAARPSGKERGSAGSTEVSEPEGLKALARYLSRTGFTVSEARTPDLPAPPGAALVVVAADLSQAETDALLDRVSTGLPLLVASDDANAPLWVTLGLPVDGSGGPGRVEPAFPSAAVRGVERVEVEGSLRVSLGTVIPVRAGTDPKKRLPSQAGWVMLLADAAGAVALEKRIGAGELILLTDPSVLSNAGLPRGKNLRFADALLRHLSGPSRAVAFDEYHHGFGGARSVAGWLSAAGLLPAAWLLLFALSAEGLRRHWLRLGPPHPPPEPERRAARDFIAAYSGLLRGAGHRAYAVKALERSLRRTLLERLAVPLSASPGEVFRRLTGPAPRAAARAYRALERAGEVLGGAEGAERVHDRELLALARDVRGAESVLKRHRGGASE